MPKTRRTSESKTDQHVGQRVRLLRQARCLTQVRLAELLGLTFQQIQKYEKGANRISATRLHQLSTLLEVPVQFFFEGLRVGATKSPQIDVSSAEECIEFLRSAEGLALAKAFTNVGNPAVRRQIVKLAESLAAR